MATDLSRIVEELKAFYDFTARTVIVVGGGGGQLIDYVRPARRVIAIDQNVAALATLRTVVEERGLVDVFEFVHDDFLSSQPSGDVLVFEFCLHEMPEPRAALDHARGRARDVIVIDHAPHSPWARCSMEEDGVTKGWDAVSQFAPGRQRRVDGIQRFADFAELEARLGQHGPASLDRIEAFRGQRPITIPMPYWLALIEGR